ncbi:hypothetical protein K2Y11_18330 [bacterium]|nr:hypothetical protein [bacterium]
MLFTQNSVPQDQGNSFKTGINVFYLIVNGYSTAFTVFFRHCFGGEAFGFNAFACIGIMLLFMMGHPESPGLAGFFGLWWVALILQRIGHFTRRLRGVQIHSRFDGVSWFETILPFINRPAACALEVATCVLMGIHLMPGDLGLGRFFVFGGGAILVKFFIDSCLDHLQVRRLNDAAIEHRARVARWRSGRF